MGNSGVLRQGEIAVKKSNIAKVIEEVNIALTSIESEYYTVSVTNSLAKREEYYTEGNLAKYLQGEVKYEVEEADKNKKLTDKEINEEDKEVKKEYTIKYNNVEYKIKLEKLTNGAYKVEENKKLSNVQVKSITLNETSKKMTINDTFKLIPTIVPNDATNQNVEWNSNNVDVAIVDGNGLVTGVSEGTATITATTEDGGKTATFNVMIKSASQTLFSVVNENKAEMYGKRVIGYEANGINDWRIFYSDDSNVYLITTDYLPNEKISTAETEMTINRIFEAYWSSVPSVTSITNASRFSPVTDETMTWIGNYSKNNNGKCVSTLLDTSRWTAFVDTNKADLAIGSPTLNMFVASWNTKYPDEKLYCNNSSTTGYYIGNISASTTRFYSTTNMTGYKVAEENNMYFPHKSVYNTCFGYWLASPSSAEVNSVMGVRYNAGIGYFNYSTINYGVRPVVSLKSDITIDDVQIVQ